MNFFAGHTRQPDGLDTRDARRAWLLPVYRLYNHGLLLAGERHGRDDGNNEQRRHAERVPKSPGCIYDSRH